MLAAMCPAINILMLSRNLSFRHRNAVDLSVKEDLLGLLIQG